MAITSSDILNLSHALKDICEVNCNTPECLSQTLKILLQYNLIQANLHFMLANENICLPQCITDGQDCNVPQKKAGHPHMPMPHPKNSENSGEQNNNALQKIAFEHIHDHDRPPEENCSHPKINDKHK